MGPARPPAVNECAQQIIPSLILLFDGLKRAYAAKASDTDDEENEEDDSDIDEEVLSSDEDEIDDASQEYLEKLQEKVTRSSTQHGFNVSTSIQDGHGDHRSDDDGDDSEYDANEETPLECYATPLDSDDMNQDEYVVFKEVMQNIERTDTVWYRALTGHLTAEQQKALQEIILLADQRKAALESKRIEQSGGYAFHSQTVPTSFNFGGTLLSR